MDNLAERAAAILGSVGDGITVCESSSGAARSRTPLLQGMKSAVLAIGAAAVIVAAAPAARAQGPITQFLNTLTGQQQAPGTMYGGQGYAGQGYYGNQPAYNGGPQEYYTGQPHGYYPQPGTRDTGVPAQGYGGNAYGGNGYGARHQWFQNNSITQDDRRIMGMAEAQAYNAPVGATIPWVNQQTGHRGSYTVVREGIDQNTGARAKQIRAVAEIGGRTVNSTAVVTVGRDGTWVLTRNARLGMAEQPEPGSDPTGPRHGFG